HVRALLPDLGWTLGVYAPDGSAIYFAAASGERETKVDLSIDPSDDRFVGLPVLTNLSTGVDNQQIITARDNLILVRATTKGAAYRSEERAILEKATCTPARA